ncbi:protein kinase domain-containing protein [Trichothermofontia sp.]
MRQALICTHTRQVVNLVAEIGRSGEGEVWSTDRPGLCAKIYHADRADRIRKLEVMIAHPPRDPNAHLNHISFAWPQSLLQDHNGAIVGFLMPQINNSVQLLDVYNPQRRRKVLPGFNWLYLHTTAMNIASILWAIHEAGYVVGDVKPQNILVDNRALPAIIDTDSFQVRHPETGELFTCPVGSEGFTPAELLGQNLAIVEQTEVHDRFRLAVIIYLLLFGDFPFKGRWCGEGDSPEPNELLRRGFWPYAPNSLIQPGPLTIPLSIVHPAVEQCFRQCFTVGHTDPHQRPTAQDWVNVLQVAVGDLTVCRRVRNHYYRTSSGKCYWCDRKAKLGVDVFPAAHPSQLAWPLRIAAALTQQRQRLQRQLVTFPRPQLSLPQVIVPAGCTILPKGIGPQQPLSTWGQAVNRTIGQIRQWRPGPSLQPWLKQLGMITGSTVIIFGGLLLLSRSQLDREDIQLTIVGVGLFLGLVLVCFLWLKLLQQER